MKKLSEMGLRTPSTYLRYKLTFNLDDYRKKATKKAEPDAKAMALR